MTPGSTRKTRYYRCAVDDRYQFQPWYIRWYRWWRWKPYYGSKALAGWLTGHRRYNTPWRFFWTVNMSLASAKMNHLYTIDEILEDIWDG